MDQSIFHTERREPWNKGKLVGQKAPLKLKEIWAIRVRLQLGERLRELAKRTKNLRVVQLLLGHTKLESTVRYPGIETNPQGKENENSIHCGRLHPSSALERRFERAAASKVYGSATWDVETSVLHNGGPGNWWKN